MMCEKKVALPAVTRVGPFRVRTRANRLPFGEKRSTNLRTIDDGFLKEKRFPEFPYGR